ncbi:uncharacterized protein OCT59_027907 [Rhizophagus irregularis]|uniref:uncharacterized protein n=1 Tax=Rhizophagus irregularis TaxID=588596 RepID=UPI0033196CD6|nr:hypothetical protein OCT59_027907 [Rhizophagus irregularis]
MVVLSQNWDFHTTEIPKIRSSRWNLSKILEFRESIDDFSWNSEVLDAEEQLQTLISKIPKNGSRLKFEGVNISPQVSVSVPSFRLVLASVLGSKVSAFDSWVFGLASVGINFALWIDRMESSCSHLEGFRRFWFSGYWMKEFEGSELPFGELRRTSKVQNAESKESRKTNFQIFFSWILREGFQLVWILTWFQLSCFCLDGISKVIGFPDIMEFRSPEHRKYSGHHFESFIGLWFFRRKFQRTLKYSSRLIFEGPMTLDGFLNKISK